MLTADETMRIDAAMGKKLSASSGWAWGADGGTYRIQNHALQDAVNFRPNTMGLALLRTKVEAVMLFVPEDPAEAFEYFRRIEAIDNGPGRVIS